MHIALKNIFSLGMNVAFRDANIFVCSPYTVKYPIEFTAKINVLHLKKKKKNSIFFRWN